MVFSESSSLLARSLCKSSKTNEYDCIRSHKWAHDNISCFKRMIQVQNSKIILFMAMKYALTSTTTDLFVNLAMPGFTYFI